MKRTILFLLLSSLMLLCSLFVDSQNSTVRVLTYLGGLLFWVFLLLGYFMFSRFSKIRKQQKNNRSVDRDGKPGIIVFFSNPSAKKADIVMIVSFVISVALTIIKQIIKGSDPTFYNFLFEFISVLSFAIFLFAIQMHAILNGVNYHYYLSTISSKGRNKSNVRRRAQNAASEGDNEPKLSEEEINGSSS